MAKPVIMPKQGQSVESCIITEWYKQKGDKISPGDVLFSYETDKASFEEEASEEGTLLEIFFNDGDEVPVLTTVCVIGEEGEDISEYVPSSISDDTTPESSPEPSPEEVQKHTEDLPEGSETKKENASDGEKSLKISPRAKILAKEKGVSTKEISGSGPGGRIIVRDVAAVLDNRSPMTEVAKEKSLNEETSVPESGSGLGGMVTSNDVSSVNPLYDNDFEEKPLTNMRKLIANAMYASLQNSAQLTHHLGADARNVLALRKEVKKKIEDGEEDTNITINDMVCYATIKALKKFPRVNAQLHDYNMRLFNKVHLGLAVDTERGLMVPTIKNADDLSIKGLSNQFKNIAAKCHKGNVDPELLSPEGASFTVSNLGNYGVEMFTPVINLPQVAILGVNTIVPRPKDLGDGVYGFVPYMGLSLTYDHRALDGGEATRFLKQIAVEIETLKIEW